MLLWAGGGATRLEVGIELIAAEDVGGAKICWLVGICKPCDEEEDEEDWDAEETWGGIVGTGETNPTDFGTGSPLISTGSWVVALLLSLPFMYGLSSEESCSRRKKIIGVILDLLLAGLF